jgi:hypothetical protein
MLVAVNDVDLLSRVSCVRVARRDTEIPPVGSSEWRARPGVRRCCAEVRGNGAVLPAGRVDEPSVNGMVTNHSGYCVDQVRRVDWLGDVELETCLPRRILIFTTRQRRKRNRGRGYSRGAQ